MKYKYAVKATQTQIKEGFIVVEAHNEEEAKVIANESESWDWDEYDPEFVIDSVKQTGPAEEDDEDEE